MMDWDEKMLLPWTWPLFLMRKTTTTLNDLVDIRDLVDINFQNIHMEYPGNRAVETVVYSKVASPGTQLGVLADAVLELAQATGSNNGEEITRLQGLVGEIKRNKEQILKTQVRESLKQMKKAHSENFRKELEEIVKKVEAES